MAEGTLYDTDIVAWAEQQVAELRRLAQAAPSNAVDWDNLIEELEGVGRSQVNAVERQLVHLVSHLVKLISAPGSPAARGWRAEIVSFQHVARKRFSPSMRRQLDRQELWRDACAEAGAGLSLWGDDLIRGLPAENPFALDELLSPHFDLDEALKTLADAIRPTAG
jgi:hypothetical protein